MIAARWPPRRSRWRVGAEDALVRGVRDDHEVVLADVEAAERRPLADDADDRVLDAPMRTFLPIGSMPGRANSAWYGVVAEHDHAPPVLHLGW